MAKIKFYKADIGPIFSSTYNKDKGPFLKNFQFLASCNNHRIKTCYLYIIHPTKNQVLDIAYSFRNYNDKPINNHSKRFFTSLIKWSPTEELVNSICCPDTYFSHGLKLRYLMIFTKEIPSSGSDQERIFLDISPSFHSKLFSTKTLNPAFHYFNTIRLTPPKTSLSFLALNPYTFACETICFGSCHKSFFLGNKSLYSANKLFKQIWLMQPDLLLLLGDQLYSDNMGRIFPTDRLSRYLKHYSKQFNHIKWLKRVLNNTPTMTILDDHEIYNNFSDQILSGMSCYQREWLNDGYYSYRLFQGLHNPIKYDNDVIPSVWNDQLYKSSNLLSTSGLGPESNLNSELGSELGSARNWYHFDRYCASFFVMDLRMERTENHQISQLQLENLLLWLYNTPNNRFKIIITSIPAFPAHQQPKDDWMGNSQDALEIFEFINMMRINNVYFWSGDSHYSLVSHLYLHDSEDASSLISTMSSSTVEDIKLKLDCFAITNNLAPKEVSGYRFRLTTICSSPFKCLKIGKLALDLNKERLPIPFDVNMNEQQRYYYVDNRNRNLESALVQKECFCRAVFRMDSMRIEFIDDRGHLLNHHNFVLIQ